jgi:Ca-activated chloride channel homolog
MRRRNNSLSIKKLTSKISPFTFGGLALAIPVFLLAQQAGKQPETPDTGEPTFSTETRLVQLPVTVSDKSGHLVTTLQQSAFQVFENNVQQAIKLFKREDVPISLGLVIDNSGSMREKRTSVESAALALVRDSNKQDEVFVVNFNDEPYLDADFTSDISLMEQGLTKIDSRGGTAMRDAIRVSVDHLKDKAKRDKRVILVVTDGNDNASTMDLDSLVRLAQCDDVLIYAIGLLSEEEKREAGKAKRALNTLTESTGGVVYYPKEVSEVEKIAHEVAYDIRNQYTIGYTPSNTALDGTFRPVKVVVKAPGNPVARTRSGYYAIAPKEQGKSAGGASLSLSLAVRKQVGGCSAGDEHR